TQFADAGLQGALVPIQAACGELPGEALAAIAELVDEHVAARLGLRDGHRPVHRLDDEEGGLALPHRVPAMPFYDFEHTAVSVVLVAQDFPLCGGVILLVR